MTLNGYRGEALDLLKKYQIEIGDHVCVETKQGGNYCGIIIPRYENATPDRIVVKLENGYNTGVTTQKVKNIVKIDNTAKTTGASIDIPSMSHDVDTIIDDNIALIPAESDNLEKLPGLEDLPKVSLISTGGTISSKIDYRTGGVRSALTAHDLYDSVPELRKYSSIEPHELFTEYSENITPEHWTTIAKTVEVKFVPISIEES